MFEKCYYVQDGLDCEDGEVQGMQLFYLDRVEKIDWQECQEYGYDDDSKGGGFVCFDDEECEDDYVLYDWKIGKEIFICFYVYVGIVDGV